MSSYNNGGYKQEHKAAQRADMKRMMPETKSTDLTELRSRKSIAKAQFTKSRHQLLIILKKRTLTARI